MSEKDERIKLMNEILSGIKVSFCNLRSRDQRKFYQLRERL